MRIAQACLDRGHTVRVFTTGWQGERPGGLDIRVLPASGFTNHARAVSFARRLEAMNLRGRHDLVCGFNRLPNLDLYYAADVCYVRDMARRRPAIVRLTPRYRVYSAFERAVFSPDSTTHVMYLSEAEKAIYQQEYNTPEARFHYLPPGIDRERIVAARAAKQEARASLGLNGGSVILLMVGSDFVRKGVSRAITALASLPAGLRRQCSLVVVGKGRSKRLARMAARLGIGQQVIFTGPRADVPLFLYAADLLVHPPLAENTGNVILEAMVAGLPVLATANCGYAFHVERSGGGKTAPHPFVQERFNSVLRAMLTGDDLSGMGRRGAAYAQKTDLYSRPRAAAAIMEELARQ